MCVSNTALSCLSCQENLALRASIAIDARKVSALDVLSCPLEYIPKDLSQSPSNLTRNTDKTVDLPVLSCCRLHPISSISRRSETPVGAPPCRSFQRRRRSTDLRLTKD